MNYDTLCELVSNVSIGNTKETIGVLGQALDSESRAECEHRRLNPLPYLGQLVGDPGELLRSMLMCGVLLSGSRAAEYFCPGACLSTSDWDFFGDTHSTRGDFMDRTSKLGMRWDRHPDNNSLYPPSSRFNGSVVHRGTTHAVQLVIFDKSAFDGVIQFHSSIVQCFISGFGAACMYKELTARSRSLTWVTESDYADPMTPRRCREKYAERGVKYVSWEQYSNTEVLDDGVLNDPNPRVTQRHIGDSDACFIDFDVYYNDTVSAGAAAECASAARERLRWFEAPYMCVPPETVTHLPMAWCPYPTSPVGGLSYNTPALRWDRAT